MPFLASAIAISQLLNFSLDLLSRLLNTLGMSRSPDYRKAYRAAKRELASLLSQQQKIEKRLVVVRQSIQTLAALCEEKGFEVAPSEEADILLKNTAIADEIRNILKSEHPRWLRPGEVKGHLERLGHDMTKYNNPQATIQMVLKRMVESSAVEEDSDPEGKKIYRASGLLPMYGLEPTKPIIGRPSGGFARAFRKLDSDSKLDKARKDAFSGR